MKNLLHIEKILNDLYVLLDQENRALSNEDKIKKAWVLSIEGLNYIDGLRKDMKKFTRSFTN